MFSATTGSRIRVTYHHRTLLLSALAMLTIAGCGGEKAPSSSSSPDTSTPTKNDSSAIETTETETAEAPAKTESSETVVADAAAAIVDAKPAEPKKPVDPNATGSFFGAIVLDGDAPELAPLVSKDDENVKDREVCGAADVPDETLVVGEGNGIANVFVYLRRAPKGYKSDIPSDGRAPVPSTARLHQRNV
ncbi:MAG: hypothetical protein ABGZ23_10210 [Fuerstiella sp.]